MSRGSKDVSLARLLISTTPAVLLLLAIVAWGQGEKLSAKMMAVGESWYPGYGAHLRHDPERPTCDPEKIAATAAAAKPESDDLLDGLDDDGDDVGEDSGDTPEAAPAPKPAAAPADDDAEGDDDDDVLDDLFGEEDDSSAAAGLAVAAAVNRCKERHIEYATLLTQITPAVKRFRTVETFTTDTTRWLGERQAMLLVLLFMICAATATWLRGHIALRPARTALDHRIAEGAQLVANLAITYSCYAFKLVDESSGASVGHGGLMTIFIAGFGTVAALNLWNIIRLPKDLKDGASLPQALLCVPLYASMALIAGGYFFIQEGHASGMAIYISKLAEHASMYMNVGLYVWVGMLLKRTRLAGLCFDVARPWKLPPEMLAFVVVVAAALPTAYSGASGIFVIAVGMVIYQELRKAGARRSLALAATAMSGSMGVVLRPCLLVVIVASLNKEVTTDQLFYWGFRIFLLSAVLFLIVSMLNRSGPMKIESPKVAIPESLKAIGQIVPYIAIFVTVLVASGYGVDAHLDEHSAPMILPMLLLLMLIYDRRKAKKLAAAAGEPAPRGVIGAVEEATSETTHHIGALLTLMGMSVALGGIIERAEVMSMVPTNFGSIWLAMAVLVAVLVIVGMTMDPYGAVILVSATISQVAYDNGINPVHFWMTVLVAFELGYLTPPVALNHLLTRQVVGEEEAELADLEATGNFWQRHERILLPVVVMGTALLVVAFLPLAVGY